MMKNVLTLKAWNPYLAGTLAGLLAIASVVVSTKVLGSPKYLGTSTTFVRATGLLEQQVAPEHVEQNAYFQSKKVKVDWQMLLVLGIFLGALGSSLLGKEFKSEWLPPIWTQRFGHKKVTRILGALIGGLIAIFGVRLAGGCPSGHGLSGMMQLALSGLLAMVGFMVGGMVTARLLYKGGQ